jgi:hypothetical protein
VLDWSPVSSNCELWWDLGPNERICSNTMGVLRTWLEHAQGEVELPYGAFAYNANTLAAVSGGVLLVDRNDHTARTIALPHASGVAALEEDLFVHAASPSSELVRLEGDGGIASIATAVGRPGPVMLVGAGDVLLIASGTGTEAQVELRPRSALAAPGTVIPVPGARFYAGNQRVWADDGHTVTAINGDGGTSSISRPPAGAHTFLLEAPGPKRPVLTVPTVVDSQSPYDDHPIAWIPIDLPDGGLGKVAVAIGGQLLTFNDQWLFFGGTAARFPE